MKKVTHNIEFVEAHNIALSLRRLRNAPGYHPAEKTKRALFFAVLGSQLLNRAETERLRLALDIP